MIGSSSSSRALLFCCWMLAFLGKTAVVRGFRLQSVLSSGRSSIAVVQHQQKRNRYCRLFSSSSSAEDTEAATTSEEDLARWERMYQQGALSENEQQQQQSRAKIRVITFDLDNTIWKTSDTISAANDALAAFLESKNIIPSKRVELVMRDICRKDPSRYSPVTSKGPVFFTLLRKDAIRYILRQEYDYTIDDATILADEAFEIWTNARHDVIPRHLADSVADCLEKIDSQDIIIGAITDGNADPRNVDCLKKYFRFCINAETAGVAKPDKDIYIRAVRHVATNYNMQDVFGNEFDMDDDDALQEKIGPWWVHVGDDFVKDVVPAKNFNMRSIWARELVLDEKTKTATSKQVSSKSIDDSKVGEFVKKVSEMDVVRMPIGADDYLADSLTAEFADAVVDKFQDLSDVIIQWQNEAKNSDDTPEQAVVEDASAGDDDALTMEAIPAPINGEASAAPQKFCMFCGTKLPVAAKFCSNCGEKQPV